MDRIKALDLAEQTIVMAGQVINDREGITSEDPRFLFVETVAGIVSTLKDVAQDELPADMVGRLKELRSDVEDTLVCEYKYHLGYKRDSNAVADGYLEEYDKLIAKLEEKQ